MKKPHTIFTIGHSTRGLEEFVSLLQQHAIDLLVDVRKMPRSRRNPQFNRDTLPDSLRRAGISYLDMPGLGGLRPRRADSPNGGWKNASFQGYADYMLTAEFATTLDELIKETQGHRPCLMCAEAVPWRCHRYLIADSLFVRDLQVEHILGPSRTLIHVLKPWAHVDGVRITYPPTATEAHS